MSTTFQFEALPEPVPWTGRYNRIPGKEPAFKARVDGSACAYWSPWNSGEWLTSMMIGGPGVSRMVRAVNRAKEIHAGIAGGSFQINEFGQAICPIASSSARYWVGTVTGVPTFQDPRDHAQPFDLLLPPSTAPGTPWERPYIGMRFNLDPKCSIYFQEDDGDTKRKISLDKSDPELVRRLQQVRGSGQTIRFIVNLHGIVLTKKEPDWQPVFVGHIDLNRWFPNQS